uniref:Putative secreted protein n=1 Tax=Anopheles marajoara TaxID=58244 RepID=A0A2M4C791_9DIPT
MLKAAPPPVSAAASVLLFRTTTTTTTALLPRSLPFPSLVCSLFLSPFSLFLSLSVALSLSLSLTSGNPSESGERAGLDRKWRYAPDPSSLSIDLIHFFSSAPAWPPVRCCTIIGSSAHCCVR